MINCLFVFFNRTTVIKTSSQTALSSRAAAAVESKTTPRPTPIRPRAADSLTINPVWYTLTYQLIRKLRFLTNSLSILAMGSTTAR